MKIQQKIKVILGFVVATLNRPHGSVFISEGKIVNRFIYIYKTCKSMWGNL